MPNVSVYFIFYASLHVGLYHQTVYFAAFNFDSYPKYSNILLTERVT